jgi:hypothetical protein
MLLMMLAAPLFTRGAAVRAGVLLRMKRWQAAEIQSRIPLWPVIAVVLAGFVCVHGGYLLGKHVMDARFDPARLPVHAVEYLEKQGIHEPIFSLDSWGGYFIFRLYPGEKVFVDDRHDFYGDDFIREYLKVIHLEAGWQQALNHWGVNLVVMPPGAKLSEALAHSTGWKAVFENTTATVFRRVS